MPVKTNCQGVLSEKSKVKENKTGGEKECMCMYIHSYIGVLHTHAFACVYTQSLLEISKKGNIGYLGEGNLAIREHR